MTPILEDSALGTNLDCQGFSILNVDGLDPVPAGMVAIDDPVMSDPRTMLAGSVTNDSVSDTAAIDQSKLNLNFVMPPAWIGTLEGQAAPGQLVQDTPEKGAPNGYASLDGDGRIPPLQIVHGPASGSVNSVGLSMPGRTFNVTGSPVTSMGTLSAFWLIIPDGSYLANAPIPGGGLRPQFLQSRVPLDFIPNLDGSVFTSGQVDLSHLPMATFGTPHNAGMIPDPTGGGAEFYLGRDMQYRYFPTDIAGQPYLLPPFIEVNFEEETDGWAVVVSSDTEGTVLFYSLNGAPFQEALDANGKGTNVQKLTAQYGDNVQAYQAKQGYNNSPVALYVVTPPPGDQ